MAEHYGPWQSYGRVWFTYTHGSPDSIGNVYVAVDANLQLDGGHSSSGTYSKTWSGTWGSGSESWNGTVGFGSSIRLVSWGGYVTASYGATTPVGFGASSTHYWGSSAAELYFSIPARPYSPPRPPKTPAATRVNDSQATVTWDTDYDPSNGARPWSGVYIDRWSKSSGTWNRVASLSWSATSWSDGGISANNQYKYRISSYNSAGQSSWVETSLFATTPSAPTGVSAEKVGSSINVSWTNTAVHQDGAIVYDNGVQIATVGAGVSTYTDPSPNPAVTHTYTIRATTTTPSLQSALSTPSNTVQLQAPPNPPANVFFSKSSDPGASPSNTYSFDKFEAMFLRWTHNPVDSSAQMKYQMRYKTPSNPAWTTTTQTSSANQWSSTVTLLVLAGKWELGQFEFQVRTWGADPNPSDWSASAVFSLENDPAITILDPSPSEVLEVSLLIVDWSYSQAQSRPQQGFEIVLVEEGVEVFRRIVSSADTEFEVPMSVRDGKSYTLSLQAIASNGLMSDINTISFSVDYAEPATPILEAVFDPRIGVNIVYIENDDSPVETEFNRIYRSISPEASLDNFPSSEYWEYVDDFPAGITFSDYEGLTNGETHYVVEAVSAIPSVSRSMISVQAHSKWAWIGYGPDFSQTVAIPFDIEASEGMDLESSNLFYFDGATLPVEISGDAVDHQLTVSGSLDPLEEEGSTWEEILNMARTPGKKMYRDLDGNRIYSKISGLKGPRRGRGMRSVSFKVQEVSRNG